MPVFPDDLNSLPFVPLPASVVTFQDLMDFDRETCLVFKAFRRPEHSTESVNSANELPVTCVVVRAITSGIRTREGYGPSVKRGATS